MTNAPKPWEGIGFKHKPFPRLIPCFFLASTAPETANPSRGILSSSRLIRSGQDIPGEALPPTHSNKSGDSSGAQQRRPATGSPLLLSRSWIPAIVSPVPASCSYSPVSNPPAFYLTRDLGLLEAKSECFLPFPRLFLTN